MKGVEREVWREARRRINECETRKAELKLDEQKEEMRVKDLTERLQLLKKEVEKEKALRWTLTSETKMISKDFGETNEKIVIVQSDVHEMTRGIEELKRKVGDAHNALDQQKATFDDHIKEQEQLKSDWEAYYDQN